MTEPERQSGFRRNLNLETLLSDINQRLGPVNDQLLEDREDRHSKVFVMGGLRSGTTLFMQWLAASGLVAYPSNLLSRFYRAPLMGARIQMLLTDPRYRFRDELDDIAVPVSFRSENGKTAGALSPNEFWYFWRRFLPFQELDYVDDTALRGHAGLTAFRDEVNALANLFDQPFAMKGMIINQNILPVAEQFRDPLFVWIKRDPLYNLQSVLEARLRQHGDVGHWYSFKIREYPELNALPPLASAAGQVVAINQALEQQFRQLPDKQALVVPYEAFCADTQPVFDALQQRLSRPSAHSGLPAARNPSAQFHHQNSWRLEAFTREQAEQALENATEHYFRHH